MHVHACGVSTTSLLCAATRAGVQRGGVVGSAATCMHAQHHGVRPRAPRGRVMGRRAARGVWRERRPGVCNMHACVRAAARRRSYLEGARRGRRDRQRWHRGGGAGHGRRPLQPVEPELVVAAVFHGANGVADAAIAAPHAGSHRWCVPMLRRPLRQMANRAKGARARATLLVAVVPTIRAPRVGRAAGALRAFPDDGRGNARVWAGGTLAHARECVNECDALGEASWRRRGRRAALDGHALAYGRSAGGFRSHAFGNPEARQPTVLCGVVAHKQGQWKVASFTVHLSLRVEQKEQVPVAGHPLCVAHCVHALTALPVRLRARDAWVLWVGTGNRHLMRNTMSPWGRKRGNVFLVAR